MDKTNPMQHISHDGYVRPVVFYTGTMPSKAMKDGLMMISIIKAGKTKKKYLKQKNT